FGLGPLPRRMARGSAALFGLNGGVLWRRGGGGLASFELAAVQGLELGLELLVFQLHPLALAPFLIQLAVEFFQLVFVVALRPADLLITTQDPAGGQAFQIGAPIPVRATEVVRQVLKFRHALVRGW